MRNRKAAMGAAALWILIPATPVPAHHSRVVFDEEKTITIEGVMTNVAWANPHSLFFVSARPADQPDAPVTRWSVEGPRVRELTLMGWERDDIQEGDKVRIIGHPRKDGRQQILLIEIRDEKGHHFVEKREE